MLIPKTRKEIYQAYLSGDTHLELPKPVTRDEIILYNACINGAGTNPSWNDLTDKPFGTEIGTTKITWDGDTTGLSPAQNYFYKVSDTPLTKEQLLGGTCSVEMNGQVSTIDITEDAIGEMGTFAVRVDWLEYEQDIVMSVMSDANPLGYTVGLWFLCMSDGVSAHVSELTYTAEVVKPIDPKYIVLTSPNGTKYNLSVADDGTLSATEAT